jgi:hypothetical protein
MQKYLLLKVVFYTWTINTFGILVMILLQTFSIHQGMDYHNEIMLNPNIPWGFSFWGCGQLKKVSDPFYKEVMFSYHGFWHGFVDEEEIIL